MQMRLTGLCCLWFEMICVSIEMLTEVLKFFIYISLLVSIKD